MPARDYAQGSQEHEEEAVQHVQAEEEASIAKYSAEGQLPEVEHQYRTADTATASTRAYDNDSDHDDAHAASAPKTFRLGSPACTVEKNGDQVRIRGTSSNDKIKVRRLDNGKLRVTCNGESKTFSANAYVSDVHGGKGTDQLAGNEAVESHGVEKNSTPPFVTGGDN